jgi:ABC-type phosphate transport system permease subunit
MHLEAKMKLEKFWGTLAIIMVFLLVSIFTSCYQRSGSGGTNVSAKNHLANTTWESDERILVFGENGFRDGKKGSDSPISGTYSISGDSIVFEYDFLGPQQARGSLIGDTLSVWFQNYKRVK